jgi:hypothetical protein
MNPRAFPRRASWVGVAGALALTLILLCPPGAVAQRSGTVVRDEPTAYQPPTEQPPLKEHCVFFKVLQAICWYVPNRIVDLTDIPRFYFTAGDGMGVSVRATSYLNATWFEDNAACLGWSMRQPPFFTEQIRERYFGLLFARQGELDRDPSEIGLSAHFIVVGANISASLSEAVDFCLGFLGIDLRADDHGPVLYDLTKKKPAPTPPASAQASAAPQQQQKQPQQQQPAKSVQGAVPVPTPPPAAGY